MPYIVNIETAFPENLYKQTELVDNITRAWGDKIKNTGRVKSIHTNVLVNSRHLALPVEKYFEFESFDQKNSAYIDMATKVSTKAIQSILKKYSLHPTEISSLWSNTVTGFAIPSLEARVMNKLDFATATKRVPLLGLGCMGGVAGINRVADYLKAYPSEAVIFFSVELCSLTFQLNDISAANIISTGLFGDGAAAVLMVGDDHPLKTKAVLEWQGSESIFFKDTENVMGWSVGASGLEVILSKGVPDIARNRLSLPINKFLEKNKLNLKEIKTFMAHPGGPKVLEAMEDVFNLGERGLYHSWDSLAKNGNMSSVSVLDIMKRTIDEKKDKASGEMALALAMGPGFSAEIGLFKWS